MKLLYTYLFCLFISCADNKNKLTSIDLTRDTNILLYNSKLKENVVYDEMQKCLIISNASATLLTEYICDIEGNVFNFYKSEGLYTYSFGYNDNLKTIVSFNGEEFILDDFKLEDVNNNRLLLTDIEFIEPNARLYLWEQGKLNNLNISGTACFYTKNEVIRALIDVHPNGKATTTLSKIDLQNNKVVELNKFDLIIDEMVVVDSLKNVYFRSNNSLYKYRTEENILSNMGEYENWIWDYGEGFFVEINELNLNKNIRK